MLTHHACPESSLAQQRATLIKKMSSLKGTAIVHALRFVAISPLSMDRNALCLDRVYGVLYVYMSIPSALCLDECSEYIMSR